MESNLLAAAEALVKRIEELHEDPRYLVVFEHWQNHHGGYHGTKYTEELAALRAACAVERERLRDKLILDDPADRLYHAADKTWWKRVDGVLVSAEASTPPEPAGEEPSSFNDMESRFIKSAAKEIDHFACDYKMALQRAFHAGYWNARPPATVDAEEVLHKVNDVFSDWWDIWVNEEDRVSYGAAEAFYKAVEKTLRAKKEAPHAQAPGGGA